MNNKRLYKYMKLELNPKECQLIREGLGKLPFDEVAALILKIEQQLKEQIINQENKQ